MMFMDEFNPVQLRVDAEVLSKHSGIASPKKNCGEPTKMWEEGKKQMKLSERTRNVTFG